jgi:bifunctional DNA-binding transcriptional regulator/antitoxin component of YhaV-PrlF toxin-antitoxin module
MANVVGERGQVVIEKPIRDALGIQPGFMAVQTLVQDHVELRFYPPEHRRSLKGALAGLVRGSVSPEEWRGAKDRAWSDRVDSEFRREGKGGPAR